MNLVNNGLGVYIADDIKLMEYLIPSKLEVKRLN